MYFRFAKKVISPGVASPSDAAPVICSAGSPTNSPPDSAAMSRRVKVTEALDCFGATPKPARDTRALPRVAASLSFPARQAFFDEGLYAFERGFVHHVARHDLARRFVCGCDTEFRLAVEKFFADCDDDARFGQNADDKFLKLSVELVGFCDAVNQAARFCLLRADEFAGHQHLERRLAQNIS